MNRQQSLELLTQANNAYIERLRYLSPELHPTVGRNPAKLVEKMIGCVPLDTQYDKLVENFAILTRNACQFRLDELREAFWEPMSNEFLGNQLGEIDTEWKQKMVQYWIGELDYRTD